jgi:D-glycero-D-manno-heptose 1,7-bisphosphate phosphatase
MERAVFLDRDGTIIEHVDYVYDCSQVKLIPRASEAIRLLNESGFRVIIITNQPGVARGYFTEETVKEINKYIQECLAKQGARIDKAYYCPHHTEGTIEEYAKECDCRKPKPGMIERAVREVGIDLEGSFVIGDRNIDVEAGDRAGCKTILLTGKDHLNNEEEITTIADYIAPDLYEAVEWLMEFSRKQREA